LTRPPVSPPYVDSCSALARTHHQDAAEVTPKPYERFPTKRGRNWRHQRLEIPVFTRLLNLPSNAQVLEIGCGCGIGLPIIAERCHPARLVGLDIDAELLADARSANSGQVELVWGDVELMPFEDRSFDLIIDFGTCYHVARPWEALGEISRVLRVGGFFAYETPLNQLLSHPIRSGLRRLPWQAATDLVPTTNALLWAARRKRERP
jgi:ubiquinone/menaquinone biosynthesis C-methylase UbiE